MFTKSVAVLDIRSSEITAAVVERGVNNTFIIKSKVSRAYDGYAEGELLDYKSFYNALSDVISETLSTVNKNIKKFYVGIPGEFTKVINTEKAISFSSAKRIKKSDVANLNKLAAPQDTAKYVNVQSGCVYYVLSDKRRTINPVGEISDSLNARLCFYMARKNFVEELERVFNELNLVVELKVLPSVHTQAMYLIPPEKRDEVAVMFDFGYISSTFSVVCGNGVVYSESFSIGVGHLAYLLCSELSVPYEVAYAFLQKVNLNAREKINTKEVYVYEGTEYSFATSDLRDKIRTGLDSLCEIIEECRQGYQGNLDGKTLLITGEGVNCIRGACEHISSRLVRNVEVIKPAVPYYDKPQLSSLFSLMDAALDEQESSSFFKRF